MSWNLDRTARLQPQSLDAALCLLAMRQQVISHIDQWGRVDNPEVQVLGIGLTNIRRELCRQDIRHELLSINTSATGESLWYAHDSGKRLAKNGVRLRSLFDYATTDAEGLEYVRAEHWLQSGLCAGPVQLKIYDRRRLIIEGPTIDGQRSVVATTDKRALACAWRYWHFVESTAVAVPGVTAEDPLAEFSPRQREIAYMMADEQTDEVISARLGISLRTVRAEVDRLKHLLNVRTRFGLGLRLGQLSSASATSLERAQSTE